MVSRIPSQEARDRQAVAAYLRDLATAVATGRVACDPYGVLVAFVGPEVVDVGTRGLVVRNDYRRLIREIPRVLQDNAYGPLP